jgi:hypothetical protein
MKPYAEMIPTVRITLESMRAQIINAFSDYDGAIARAVKARVEEVITPEAVLGMIEKEIEEMLRQKIRQHLQSAVEESLYNARESIQRMVADSLREKLRPT